MLIFAARPARPPGALGIPGAPAVISRVAKAEALPIRVADKAEIRLLGDAAPGQSRGSHPRDKPHPRWGGRGEAGRRVRAGGWRSPLSSRSPGGWLSCRRSRAELPETPKVAKRGRGSGSSWEASGSPRVPTQRNLRPDALAAAPTPPSRHTNPSGAEPARSPAPGSRRSLPRAWQGDGQTAGHPLRQANSRRTDG